MKIKFAFKIPYSLMRARDLTVLKSTNTKAVKVLTILKFHFLKKKALKTA